MMPIELRWTTPSTVRMGTLPPSRPPSPKPSGQVVGSAISTSTRVYCSRTTPVSSWGSSSTASSAPPRGSRLGGGGGGGQIHSLASCTRDRERGRERGRERETHTHILRVCARARAGTCASTPPTLEDCAAPAPTCISFSRVWQRGLSDERERHGHALGVGAEPVGVEHETWGCGECVWQCGEQRRHRRRATPRRWGASHWDWTVPSRVSLTLKSRTSRLGGEFFFQIL